MQFVNSVRKAQGHDPLEAMPEAGADGSTPLELAMGCRLQPGLMKLSSPQAAAVVAEETGLPVGVDRVSIGLPSALDPYGRSLHAERSGEAEPPLAGGYRWLPTSPPSRGYR